MQAKGARVLAGLRSGDGLLSVRARPSSIKRDCGRRTTSTGENCLVNVHAKSCLTLEPLRTLRSEDKGQAGACPDRTRAIPCKVRAITTELSMIRNMHAMILTAGDAAAPLHRAPGLRITSVPPRCPRTTINSQRSPPAATCEHEASADFEPASNAREHPRNA